MVLYRTTVAWPSTALKQSCRSPVRQYPPHCGGPGRVGLLCRGCADRGRAHPAYSLQLLLPDASVSGAGLSRSGLPRRGPDDVRLLDVSVRPHAGGAAFLRYMGGDTRSVAPRRPRSEEHTSELQSLMRISYAVFCLKKQKTQTNTT